jgi:hypothetical protein
VVVAVPQPPSARAETAVVFLQKEIGGQQYVVRQIPILRKEHLTVYNKKSSPTLFSLFNFLEKCSCCVYAPDPDSRIRSTETRPLARVGSVGVGRGFTI